MPTFDPLPPPPNSQPIANVRDKTHKSELEVKTDWTWQSWLYLLWQKLKTLTVLPTLGSSNQLLGVNSAGTDLEYKTLGVQGVAGTLPGVSGGTGFSSYAVGDILYANTTTTLAKLADVATGNLLKSGGVGAPPTWGTFSATGDATGTYGATGLPLTLATVNANVGSFGNSTNVASFTVNGKGLITAAANVSIAFPVTSVFGQTGAIPNLSGDVSTSGSSVTTLATVNANVGTFGDATHVAQVTVNGKGLTTAVASVLITGTSPGGAAGGDLSGTYPNPTVAKINGNPLGSTTPTSANVLIADGTSWITRALSGDLTISSTGAVTLASVVAASTNTKITYNAKGLVTAGTAAILASADFANQGTTTTVLHGNAAGNPSWAAVSLTADVSGILPGANGGTSFGSYAIGDLLYANTTTTLAKLADVADGQVLGSKGVSTAPAYRTLASLGFAIDYANLGVAPTVSAGTDGIAIGDGASVGAGSTNGVAIGQGASVGAGFTNSIALGAAATAGASNAVVIGNAINNGNASVSISASPTVINLSNAQNAIHIGLYRNGGQPFGVNGVVNNFIAVGVGTNTDFAGEMSVSMGNFVAGTSGTAKVGLFPMRATTTNATVTPLGTATGANPTGLNPGGQIVLPTVSTWVFDCLITARRTDATGTNASWRFTFSAKKDANNASTALVGTSVKEILQKDAGAANWDVGAAVDTGTGAVYPTVTGEAGKTIRWVAGVNSTKVMES